ncbi:MAG: serine/threonine-protein kinase [Acidobacteria bacterium]|nr:serine/threonine-protein kinase [Acidobacteriota bacterium]
MTLSPGTRIGPYEVLAILGTGGMGEVYRATDTQLKRPVAVKVLPEALATDADRAARFQREAELLATLAHPHIAAIYGLETSTATRALILELVEGETLADRLTRGPLPVDEALALARQLADALDYAHEHGVLHRDLKPANLTVTPEGRLKVLDFGLAKAMETGTGSREPGSASLANSPTVTSPAMTQAGVILGTAAYMSPEQARAQKVDKRADVWAFGCVLFELLTGTRAFGGDTLVEVLGAVQHTEPDWARLPKATPPGVRRLLERTLTKDPARRLRDIGDAALLLDVEFSAPQGRAPRPLRPWQRPAPALAGAVLVAALGTAAGWGLRPAPGVADPHATHLTIDPPPDAPLSNRGGLDLAVSPNGRLIAFLADGPSGRQLYLRDLSAPASVPLPGTEGADDPFFSWDGRSIVFESRAESKLMRIPVSGGTPVPIPGAHAQTRGIVWTPEDVLISAYDDALWRLPIAGGTPERLLDGRTVVGITSRVLPGGRGLIFDRVKPAREILALDLRTGETPVLLQGQNASFVPSGHLVFTRDTSLLAVGFDAERLRVTGEPVTLVEGLRVVTGAASDFAVSDTGTLAYVAGGTAATDRTLQWVDRDGRVSDPAARRAGVLPRLSPDGRWLVLITRSGTLWTVDLQRGTENRLATDAMTAGVAWTADSRELAFVRRLDAGYAVDVMSPEGEGAPTRLLTTPRTVFIGSWSPDGRVLGLTVGVTEGGRDLAFLDRNTGALDVPAASPFDESAPRFSPDGRFIAYASEESGRPQIYVRGHPGGARLTVSVDGGQAPVWSRDGRTLYFAGPVVSGLSSLMAATIDASAGLPRAGVPSVALAMPLELAPSSGGIPLYDVAADGRFVTLRSDADDAAANNRIHVILDWTAMLRDRAR